MATFCSVALCVSLGAEVAAIAEPAKIKVKKEKPTETFVNNRPRPLFKDNYERYEWHIKNGCIGIEDRRWFEEYIKSEEYRNIYE